MVGLDHDPDRVEHATGLASTLGLRNVSIVQDTFLSYSPELKFDVVLSVCSAHYLTEQGHGEELFARFRSWLSPSGYLVLLGPRTFDERDRKSTRLNSSHRL